MKKCVGSRKPEKVAEEIGKTMPMEKRRPSANTVAAVVEEMVVDVVMMMVGVEVGNGGAVGRWGKWRKQW